MRFKTMAFVAALSVALPALAQTAEPAAPPKEKKVCRREAVTGSILGGARVCHTRAEWLAIDRKNGEGADRLLDNGRQQQNSRVSSNGINGL